MSKPLKFHRVAKNGQITGTSGHVYFIYDTDGTGTLKVAGPTGQLEDYSNTARIESLEAQLAGLETLLESI